MRDQHQETGHELTACLCSKMSPEERDSVFHFQRTCVLSIDRIDSRRSKRVWMRTSPVICCDAVHRGGVDISFPVVFRAWAPLEAIIQTAGRCNRNNELFPEKGICHVFTPIEEKFPMGFYGSVTAVTRSYVESLDEEAKVYLDDPSVIETYYTRLYDVLNQPTSAKKFKDICEALEGSDFITVAEKYRLIEQDMVNLVVPYGEEGRQRWRPSIRSG